MVRVVPVAAVPAVLVGVVPVAVVLVVPVAVVPAVLAGVVPVAVAMGRRGRILKRVGRTRGMTRPPITTATASMAGRVANSANRISGLIDSRQKT